ncbi:cyclin-dependent kinase 20-like [Myiozetetes cayanensis]|uniref:cyclin-dependent kinase 20-like n=1 Tax=Myiozetetes cayanensis TaxID=478635 RepID=UPI002160DDA9|nr:cyclin-dependent kinase 20-like [Myiozetetes cayanensis]
MTLRGLRHVHGQHLLHRDLKPANLLLGGAGASSWRFGLPGWYRAPELLYGARSYDEGVDLWAVGCIFGELLTLSPLFPGENDIEQLCCVLRALGTPSTTDWPELAHLPDYPKLRFRPRAAAPLELLVPGAEPAALDLLGALLRSPPRLRPRAHQALLHPSLFGPHQLTPPPPRGPDHPDFSLDTPGAAPTGALGPLPTWGTPVTPEQETPLTPTGALGPLPTWGPQ